MTLALLASAIIFAPACAGRSDETLSPNLGFELIGADTSATLADLRGHAVVVNFFASWCTPCLTEMPALNALAQDTPAGVSVLGLAVNDRREDVEDLVSRLKVSYPTGLDRRGEVRDAAGVIRLPTTIVVAPDGRIVNVHSGEADADELETMFASAERSLAPDG